MPKYTRPTKTSAKMRVYAGLANYVVYACTKVPLDGMTVRMIAMTAAVVKGLVKVLMERTEVHETARMLAFPIYVVNIEVVSPAIQEAIFFLGTSVQ